MEKERHKEEIIKFWEKYINNQKTPQKTLGIMKIENYTTRNTQKTTKTKIGESIQEQNTQNFQKTSMNTMTWLEKSKKKRNSWRTTKLKKKN